MTAALKLARTKQDSIKSKSTKLSRKWKWERKEKKKEKERCEERERERWDKVATVREKDCDKVLHFGKVEAHCLQMILESFRS